MKAPSTTELNAMTISTSKPTAFPSTLHRMLIEFGRDESKNSLRKTISWQEHGMAFKIHDRKKFMEVVMPLWFPRLKYASWIRQLNSYGFKRVVADGNDKSCVYHESFLRDFPEMAVNIERVPKKKKGKASKVKDMAFDTLSSTPNASATFGYLNGFTDKTDKPSNTPFNPLMSLPSKSGLHGMLMRTKAMTGHDLPSTPWFPTMSGGGDNLMGMNVFMHQEIGPETTSPDDALMKALQVLNIPDDDNDDDLNMPIMSWEDVEEPINLEDDMEPLRIFAPGAAGVYQQR